MSSQKRPLNEEIADAIREAVISRKFLPGDNLPTENELARQYKTSRVTVRKALNVLCNEDLIYSHQGKGYFVRQPEYNRFLLQFDLIKPEHEVKINKLKIIKVSEEIKELLSLEDNVAVMIQIILLHNNFPVGYENKYLPYRKGFPTIESLIHYADFPELVDRKATHFELHCELEISPGVFDSESEKLIDCSAGEPVLVVKRWIKNDENHTVGYGISYLRKEYGALSAESSYMKNLKRAQPE